MTSQIIRVARWTNPGTSAGAIKGEVRVYVHAHRGEFDAAGRPYVVEGCLYVTGNSWNVKGSRDGDLTDEEWVEAKRLAFDPATKRYISREFVSRDELIAAHRAEEAAKAAPSAPALVPPPPPAVRREFVLVPNRRDRTVPARVLVDCGRYEDRDDEGESLGWRTATDEPTDAEKVTPEYAAAVAEAERDAAAEREAVARAEALRQHRIAEAARWEAAHPDETAAARAADRAAGVPDWMSEVLEGTSDN